ncbi:ABC transporter ATP-binding protein [Hathewaya histolytica]|uniref:ABC-type multidrug transport system, ATPase and permease component n=1 Tax=Hathewaya histolytica TaxID=1498 RepID=A0A4U9RIY4_HATHI|nr:ABC transporter ATP-binding protein [Hathewaya histolytica]VTQ92022.1 ABC-type multidrug transport system, ATPase and permease component [Hathewaya histolytica]
MAINATREDEKISYHSKSYIIKRLLKYLKPFKKEVAVVITLMVFVMICSLLNPYLLKIAIDTHIKNKDINGLAIIAIILTVLNLLAMIASKKRIKDMAKITNKILINIRHELYTHIQKLSFSFFDNRPVGKILARVMGDVNALQDLFNTSVTNLVPELLSLISVTLMMFWMNYKLALWSITILPILFIALFSIEAISTKRWGKFRQKRSNLNAFTHEDFSGIKLVQSYASEEKRANTFKEMTEDMLKAFIRSVRLNDFFWPLVELSWGAGSILVYIAGIRLINSGDISIGTLISFTIYITMFWRPIMNISDFYNTLITNLAAGERIFEILDLNPLLSSEDGAPSMPKIKGNIEFKNVDFSYDKETKVLDNLSFKVNEGESIALVGATGAGKTTIINLISRFYDVNLGEVLIDGINIKDVDLESLRSQMGIMLQDTFLFSDTIKENIKYGKLDATDEEIMNAAKAVNAHGFIQGLEKGYDTEVKERGSRLSVGQRQLISFARALLADPRILILDEATSNIDTYTEMLVQEGIKKLLKGRTSFVIAHRLSTIRDCDKIMVIEDGGIKECGTHEELIKKKGTYYKLYMTQYKFLKEGA